MIISFVIMYAVMFLNVFSFDHIYLSTTRTYMTLLMVAPMAVVMMLMMPKMYPNKKLNKLIIAGGIITFCSVLFLLREQIPVGDKAWMRAMIPHHSSAILTSSNSDLKDPEVKKLAHDIIATQEKEIAQMKAILERLESGE